MDYRSCKLSCFLRRRARQEQFYDALCRFSVHPEPWHQHGRLDIKIRMAEKTVSQVMAVKTPVQFARFLRLLDERMDKLDVAPAHLEIIQLQRDLARRGVGRRKSDACLLAVLLEVLEQGGQNFPRLFPEIFPAR